MRNVKVAALQMSMSTSVDENIATAERLVRSAAKQGAQIILIPELFEGHYFCKDQTTDDLQRAIEMSAHPTVAHFAKIAKELNVVLPISVYERANNSLFNTVAIVDADGKVLGTYRKSHIPDGPGYNEKFYFSPGDTGFKVWQTKFAKIGVGICWDQWFPECARVMALMGAELLLYPTAIGSEPPPAPDIDSREHWQRTQQGHAAANVMPLIASNRWGVERSLQDPEGLYLRFYGSSFIADASGAKLAEAPQDADAVLTASFDLEALALQRANWYVFRDRRPELYSALCTYDGVLPQR